MTVPRSTFLQAAYDHVRARVIDGTLPPGSRVTVRPLAEHLGLSPTPIKAALATLAREGFLVSIPHRGYFIPKVDAKDLLEIYELREAVDGMAARRAAAGPNRAEVADRLEELLDRQRRSVEDGDLRAYRELDVSFHQLIWEGSGNLRLLSFAQNLTAQVRLGNQLSAQAPGRLPDALDEHAAIAGAIRSGDAAAAERHVRLHVRRSAEALYRYANRDERHASRAS
ncbi:MAG TPA: GntR family transcriptional regulator [Streptosporangiales bacterium]